MKLSDMFPRKYMRGDDLQGREFSLTIDRIEQETVFNQKKNTAEKKWVLYFVGAKKGLILNWTLGSQIDAATGSRDDSTAWLGKVVVAYPQKIKVAGQRHTVVRIKAAGQAATLPVSDLPEEADEIGTDWFDHEELEAEAG